MNLYLRNMGLLFRLQIHHSVHRLNYLPNLLGQASQFQQFGTEHLDGNCSPGAGKHMVNAVADGLPNAEQGAREEVQLAPQICQKLFSITAAEFNAHVDLGRIDLLSVLLHEVGHALGLAHLDADAQPDDLMAALPE